MRIERWDPADEKTARACYDVELAAHQADEPIEPPPSYGMFAYSLLHGWEMVPSEVWICVGDDDSVTGFSRIELPDLENRDKALGGPVVHPAVRRRGIGRELLRHAGARAEAHSRSLFEFATTAGSAGDAFAQAVGAKLDLEEVRRIQYLREIAPDTIAALRATAGQAAAGYSLTSWTGPVPEQYEAAMAGVFNAFNDAPHGENEEPAVWTANRVRERTGLPERQGLMRSYSIAALADATGEMAAFSAVAINPEQPQWGFQQLTAVIRAHRGHRLGLLTKTAMLGWLAETEPRLEWIATGNAAANEHMIAVNEQLGYRVVEPGWRFYEMPVADLR
jgi:GNAT superfamily N-acetyltransferase